MELSNLVQIVSAISTLKTSSRVVLVSSADDGTYALSHDEKLFMTKLMKNQGVMFQNLQIRRIENITELTEMKSDSTKVLHLGVLDSSTKIRTYKKILDNTHIAKLQWMLIVKEELLNNVTEEFSWQLDNKVLVLTNQMRVLDIYRAAPYTKSVTNEVTKLSIPIKMSELKWEPFTVVKEKPNSDFLEVDGFIGDLWALLIDSLHFSAKCRSPKEGVWGTFDLTTGLFNGLLGEVARGEVDIGVCNYVLLNERTKFIDFSFPVARFDHVLLVKRPNKISGDQNFTKEFSTVSWMMVLGFFFLTVLLMFTFSRLCLKETKLGISDCIIATIKIFCNMGYIEELSSKTSFRLYILVSMMTTLLLHVYYNAFLIASLTSTPLVLPFQGLQGLYDAREEWTIGFDDISYLATLFETTSYKLIENINKEMVQKNRHLLESTLDGIERVASQPNHAFIIHRDYYSYSLKNCKYLALPGVVIPDVSSLIMRKNLPITPILNYKLLEMKERGIYDKLLRKWKIHDNQFSDSCESSENEALGFEVLLPVFTFLAMGMGVAIGMVILELIWNKIYN